MFQALAGCNASQLQCDLDVSSDKRQTIQSSLDELAVLIRDLLTVSQQDSLARISCIAVKLDETRSLVHSFQGESNNINVLCALSLFVTICGVS